MEKIDFLINTKVLKPISADCIDVYQVYVVLDKYKDDRRLFSQAKMLQLFWNVYIYFCGIYIVCLEEACNITDDRQVIFHKVGNKIKKAFNIDSFDAENIQETIFTQCVTVFEEFICNNIVDFVTAKVGLKHPWVANFTVQNIFKKFLGRSLFNNFQLAVAKCEKRIMIALDGFDTLSEDFRIETNFMLQKDNEKDRAEGLRRAEFERIFYRSLVKAIERI